MHDPNASPVKSIFEGATKYDILHYLEDAKERGLTDVELDEDADDLEEEDGVIEEEDEEEEEDEVINWIIWLLAVNVCYTILYFQDVTFLADGLHSSSLAMASRSHSNRISNISSCSSSGSSCTRHPVQINRSTNCLNGGNNGSGKNW